jgi:hypothetical protein
MELSLNDLRDFLTSLDGKMFSVEFIKRTDGTRRKMLATTNFVSKLAGGQAAYDAKSKGLLVVLDVIANRTTPDRAIRSIPLDTVLSVKAKGETYFITHPVPAPTFTVTFDCARCEQTNEQNHWISGLTDVRCNACDSTNQVTFA